MGNSRSYCVGGLVVFVFVFVAQNAPNIVLSIASDPDVLVVSGQDLAVDMTALGATELLLAICIAVR